MKRLFLLPVKETRGLVTEWRLVERTIDKRTNFYKRYNQYLVVNVIDLIHAIDNYFFVYVGNCDNEIRLVASKGVTAYRFKRDLLNEIIKG